ncbi:MAG: hypothetical protein Q8K23_23610 [Sulfuritalea sp.]|nr:hypothetical protein [Sulfuritalea sp.]
MTVARISSLSRRGASPRRTGQWLAALLLAGALLFSAAGAQSQTQSPAPPVFHMAAAQPDSAEYRYAVLLYTEAFKRLGIPVEVAAYPLERRAALADAGDLDGEASRARAYGDAHPDLIRVDEAIIRFTFSLFTGNPAVTIQRLEDLAAGNLQVEYRRGILICENALKKFVPAERLATITNTEQGVKKLAAGRSDVYCDIDVYIPEVLRSPEFKGVTGIRKLFDIASVPTFPYVNKKHAALAPRLAAVLKQMKAEGLYEKFMQQAGRQPGPARLPPASAEPTRGPETRP